MSDIRNDNENPDDLIQASNMKTREEADAEIPALDLSAPAASEETPEDDTDNGGLYSDVVVPAQTPDEVRAQAINAAGGLPEYADRAETDEADAETDAEADEADADDGEDA